MNTFVYNKITEATTRFILSYGGTGSGKSYAAAQKEVEITARTHDIKTLVIRKVANTLRDSVIPSFRARIRELGLSEQFKENKSDRTFTHAENNSQIVFRGLDDPDKLKSFEGLQRILVEEAAELEFEDFLELNRRARGRDGIQITLCFNPVHEEHWLKKHFFDQYIPEATLIHSTYKDNPFLTDEDRAQIEYLKNFNHNQYRIYALGEWGLSENKSPWLFAFDREKHLRSTIDFMPSYPVYLSFDFNRHPVSCLAVQMSPNKGDKDSFVHFVKEFTGDVQLSELCTRIKAAFPQSIIYVTGDASGNHGDIGFDKPNSTYYQMIKTFLNLTPKQLQLNSRNLQHNDSRLLINTLFADYPSLYISKEGCPELMNDCIIATVDENSNRPGILKKDRNIYKMDLFDAMRYFFQTWFSDYSKKALPKLNTSLQHKPSFN